MCTTQASTRFNMAGGGVGSIHQSRRLYCICMEVATLRFCRISDSTVPFGFNHSSPPFQSSDCRLPIPTNKYQVDWAEKTCRFARLSSKSTITGFNFNRMPLLNLELEAAILISPVTLPNVQLTGDRLGGFAITRGLSVQATLQFPPDCSSDALIRAWVRG